MRRPAPVTRSHLQPSEVTASRDSAERLRTEGERQGGKERKGREEEERGGRTKRMI